MKNLSLFVFWLMALLIVADLSQVITKYFTLYYFNLGRIAVCILLVALLGLSLKINRIFLVLFVLAGLGLIYLGSSITWN